MQVLFQASALAGDPGDWLPSGSKGQAMVRIRVLDVDHSVQLVERGRAGSSLGRAKAVQHPAELAASAGPDLPHDSTPSVGQLQGDDTSVTRISAPHEVPGGMEPISEPGHRGSLHPQRLGALRRGRTAMFVKHQQQAKLGQRDLQRLDTT